MAPKIVLLALLSCAGAPPQQQPVDQPVSPPSSIVVHQSGANPFSFPFPPGAASVRMTVTDLGGHVVWSREYRFDESRSVTWSGGRSSGSRVPARMYVIRLQVLE